MIYLHGIRIGKLWSKLFLDSVSILTRALENTKEVSKFISKTKVQVEQNGELGQEKKDNILIDDSYDNSDRKKQPSLHKKAPRDIS